MIESELITFLTSTGYAAKDVAALINNRAHYTKVPQKQFNVFPRIFLQRTGINNDADLDGTKNNYIEDTFDLEVISDDITEVISVSDALWRNVHAHFGAISATKNVKGILLTNQSDDYEPKGIGGDIGLELAAFSITVIYAST